MHYGALVRGPLIASYRRQRRNTSFLLYGCRPRTRKTRPAEAMDVSSSAPCVCLEAVLVPGNACQRRKICSKHYRCELLAFRCSLCSNVVLASRGCRCPFRAIYVTFPRSSVSAATGTVVTRASVHIRDSADMRSVSSACRAAHSTSCS